MGLAPTARAQRRRCTTETTSSTSWSNTTSTWMATMPALPAGMVASRPSTSMQKERRMRRHVSRAWHFVWRLSPRLDHRNKVDGVYRHHTHKTHRAWRHGHLPRTSSCSAILKWPILALTEQIISFQLLPCCSRTSSVLEWRPQELVLILQKLFKNQFSFRMASSRTSSHFASSR